MWWDKRYGKGVIEDANGKEFYFDSSVVSLQRDHSVKRDQVVMFRINESIEDVSCACNVRITEKSKIENIKEKFDDIRQVEV